MVTEWGVDFFDELAEGTGRPTIVYRERDRSSGRDGTCLEVLVARRRGEPTSGPSAAA